MSVGYLVLKHSRYKKACHGEKPIDMLLGVRALMDFQLLVQEKGTMVTGQAAALTTP